MLSLGTTNESRAVSPSCGTMTNIGAVPSSSSGSVCVLATIVARPACEFGEHSLSAKSAAVHSVTAFGLPKTPSGASKTTSLVASCTPGSASLKVVVRSGCVPEPLSELVVSNSSMEIDACAGAAKARAASNAARRFRSAYPSASPSPAGGTAVRPEPPVFAVFPVPAFVGAVPVFPPHAFFAALFVLAARPFVAADLGRRLRLGARAVAFVRGGARWGRRDHEVPAELTRVVDLHRLPVAVLGDEHVAGEEEGVLSIGADAEQARRMRGGAGRDQLLTAACQGAAAGGAAFGRPLVGVELFIRVAKREGLARVEEEPAVAQQSEAVGRQDGVGRRLRAGRIAGDAHEFIGPPAAVAIELVPPAVVVARFQRNHGRERGIGSIRRHLEVAPVVGFRMVDPVDDRGVVDRFVGRLLVSPIADGAGVAIAEAVQARAVRVLRARVDRDPA